jgi:hypothetical protein
MEDNQNEEIFNEHVDGSSKNPSKYYKYVDLEPGVYYLKIYNGEDWKENTGRYILNTTLKVANNNEVEPNNGTVEAQLLDYNKPINGFLSWNDKIDTYEINVPKNGSIFINITSYVDEHTCVTLLDKENNEILNENIYGNTTNPAKFKKEVVLNSGKYYLEIYNGEDWKENTGNYSLEVTAKQFLPSLKVQTINDKSTIIQGITDAQQEILIKVLDKEYKTVANQNGKFLISIPKQSAGTLIEISTRNSFGTKIINTTVLDITAPLVPLVNKVTSKSTAITGKSEKGAIIFVYKGQNRIGSAFVDKNGDFKVYIKPQLKGTLLTIYAKDKAGNQSSNKNIKVN